MMQHPFELTPFSEPGIPKVRITGNVNREGSVITVQYSLSGNLVEVLLPPATPQPGRKEKLWLATCFEFFLASPGQPQYWEFNLSPSGDWNAFHMDAYRRIGFREEGLVQNPCLHVKNASDSFRLESAFDLSPIFDSNTALQAGVASVIQTRHGQESYWALTHPQSQADFHLRESFILTL
jgi:hypothetical protein